MWEAFQHYELFPRKIFIHNKQLLIEVTALAGRCAALIAKISDMTFRKLVLDSMDIKTIFPVVLKAGKEILSVYQEEVEVSYKDDSSPLTEADRRSHEVLVEGLQALYPEIPILSEEDAKISFEVRKEWKQYWLIDPLDGTKEFIKKNGEFTVNVALVENNTPIYGVVYAPVTGELYWGVEGEGAWKAEASSENGYVGEAQTLPLFQQDPDKVVVVASRSHSSPETVAFLDQVEQLEPNRELEVLSRGSSLKLCMVAEGKAELYPRLAPTMEWDTAAADAVVRGAGGVVYHYPHENFMQYNKENLLNPFFVVVSSQFSRKKAKQIIDASISGSH